MFHKQNDETEPDPFHIFLSGDAGVGKTFLVNVIIEYLKKPLVFPGQNSDEEPPILSIASIGKAACNINDTTVHTTFQLPIYGPNKRPKMELKGKELQDLQNKYKHLKVLIIDEIPMVGKLTLRDLNKFLRQIKNSNLDFGGISVLLVGDLFELPTVKQSAIFANPSLTDAWFLFKLHELTEIVRQNGDPESAALLNKMRESNHTYEDIEFIKSLSETDTTNWPANSCKLYMTNRLVDMENEKHLNEFQRECRALHIIYANDAKRDVKTNLRKITIDKDGNISDIGNLPYYPKLCEGSRVMLTKNVDISDCLINGAIGTAVKIHRRATSAKPSGVIFVQFDDPEAGNDSMSSHRHDELKDCAPNAKLNNFQSQKIKVGNQTLKERERENHFFFLLHML